MTGLRGIPVGTGVPMVDAGADFHRARRAQIGARALGLLTRRPRGQALPRALNDLRAVSWTRRRLSVIPLEEIVGTVDPTTDFDADFRPTTNRVSARWQRIALAHRLGTSLPPIAVVEHPEGYYVIDGRHRVSVARAMRQSDIEAWVQSGRADLNLQRPFVLPRPVSTAVGTPTSVMLTRR